MALDLMLLYMERANSHDQSYLSHVSIESLYDLRMWISESVLGHAKVLSS